MYQASLTSAEWAQWLEVVVTLAGLLGALWAWLFSRRCRIHLTLHLGGVHAYTDTPTGPTDTDRSTGALVVENVGSRIGRGVALAADPPLLLAKRWPSGEGDPESVLLDHWHIGDMSPAQRYEYSIEFSDEDHLQRLMGSNLTVSRRRRFLWDHSTTIRIGGPGLGAVSLVDRSSPAGMVSTPLRNIERSLRTIQHRMR